MKTRIASLFVLVLIISAATGLAQSRSNVVEINPFGGYLFGGKFSRGTNALFTSDVDVDDHATFGGRIGFLVTRSFELELQYSRTETFFVTHDGGALFGPGSRRLGDLDIDYYLGYMTFNFGHNPRLTPYVSLGAGAARLDPHVAGSSAGSENKFTASAAVGLKTMFTPNFGMRFDGRYYGTRVRNGNDRNGRNGRCDSFFDDCNSDRRDWLTNGDVNGGFVFAF
ncbi:MAG: porin family protein [Acidobacteriota bacterium]|nr:porin family protein [Acidobacteriota bacterium]